MGIMIDAVSDPANPANPADHKVATFFYGSFINLDVLAGVGLVPDDVVTARLAGFDIRRGRSASRTGTSSASRRRRTVSPDHPREDS